MNKRQILKAGYWFFLGATVICFYIGLRYDEQRVFYTLLALGLWGVSFLINRELKNL